MKTYSLFLFLITTFNCVSQIPDHWEINLPWDIIYVGSCNDSFGQTPDPISDTISVSNEEIMFFNEPSGFCFKALRYWEVLNWDEGVSERFYQIVKVDTALINSQIVKSNVTFPYTVTASDLVENFHVNQTYSFSMFDSTDEEYTINYDDLEDQQFDLIVYNHSDSSVINVDMFFEDCTGIVMNVPDSVTVEFNGEHYISLTEELLNIDVQIPCIDGYTIGLSKNKAIYYGNIGQSFELKVEISLNNEVYKYTIHVDVIGHGPDPVKIYVEDKVFSAGETVEFEVWSEDIDNLVAWFFNFDVTNATFKSIIKSSFFDDVNSNILNDDLTLRCLWDSKTFVPISMSEDDTWVTLVLETEIAGKSEDIFQFGEDTFSEIILFNNDIESYNIDLDFDFGNRIPSSIQEDDFSQSFSIYPTLIQDEVSINLKDSDIAINKINVINIQGKNIDIIWNHQSRIIDFQSVSAGMYFIEVFTSKGRFVERVVKI